MLGFTLGNYQMNGSTNYVFKVQILISLEDSGFSEQKQNFIRKN